MICDNNIHDKSNKNIHRPRSFHTIVMGLLMLLFVLKNIVDSRVSIRSLSIALKTPGATANRVSTHNPSNEAAHTNYFSAANRSVGLGDTGAAATAEDASNSSKITSDFSAQNLSTLLKMSGAAAKLVAKADSITSIHTSQVKGAFIYKVHKAVQASQSICTLTKFFNNRSNHQYPIVIFADVNYTPQELEYIQKVAGKNVHVQVVVDPTEPWRYFPPTLTETQLQEALGQCEEPPSPTVNAKCTTMKVAMGYTFMGYWRYYLMGQEKALLPYDYFVSLDADAFLTKHNMPDPFQIMAHNNLTGIYNIEAYQSGSIATGIQQAAEAVFSFPERRNHYLNSPEYSWFDKNGTWGYGGRQRKNGEHSNNNQKPSIWGCFYGGRVDFFRDPRYLEFARHMASYTYLYRTDEQAVISVAWALMAPNDKVWYLPQHDIHMGIMHHGWIDNTELTHSKEVPLTVNISRFTRNATNFPYRVNTLDSWIGFQEYRDGPNLATYLELEYAANDPVQQCPRVTGKRR